LTKKTSEYYNSLSRKDKYRKALYVWELSEEDLILIQNSKVPEEYNYLDNLLEED
jgi:hypothetical protein